MKAQYTPVAFVPQANLGSEPSPLLEEFKNQAAVTTNPLDDAWCPAQMFELPGTYPGDAETGHFADIVLHKDDRRSHFLYMDNEGYVWLSARDSDGAPTFMLVGILDPHDGTHLWQVQSKTFKWRMLYNEELFVS